MKTVKMNTRIYITILMTALVVSAKAQLAAAMLSLPTLNSANAGIDMKLKATAAKNTGEITWQVIKQIKVRRYELEKSSDGVNFSYVSAMPGSMGKQKIYSIQDKYLFNDMNFYRLKIVDNKGNYSYSKVTSFDRRNIVAEVKVMPAIANNELYIWLPANTQVNKASITDAMGRGVIENASVNNLTNLASVSVSNLATGMYQINITTNTGVTTNLKFSKK